MTADIIIPKLVPRHRKIYLRKNTKRSNCYLYNYLNPFNYDPYYLTPNEVELSYADERKINALFLNFKDASIKVLNGGLIQVGQFRRDDGKYFKSRDDVINHFCDNFDESIEVFFGFLSNNIGDTYKLVMSLNRLITTYHKNRYRIHLADSGFQEAHLRKILNYDRKAIIESFVFTEPAKLDQKLVDRVGYVKPPIKFISEYEVNSKTIVKHKARHQLKQIKLRRKNLYLYEYLLSDYIMNMQIECLSFIMSKNPSLDYKEVIEWILRFGSIYGVEQTTDADNWIKTLYNQEDKK